jgi:predicted RNase H-like nuclease (RuvC/YqgF family)
MTRIETIKGLIRRTKKADTSLLSVDEEHVDALFDELENQRKNISAVQKKLNACRNMHKQKDDMIARRDRSIHAAHQYIEILKADLRCARKQIEQLEPAGRKDV